MLDDLTELCEYTPTVAIYTCDRTNNAFTYLTLPRLCNNKVITCEFVVVY